MAQPCTAANPSVALWLQSTRPAGRAAELGALGLQHMRKLFSSLFKSKPLHVVEDPVLGSIYLKDQDWYFERSVKGRTVAVSLQDANGLPCAGAKRVWEAAAQKIDSLWDVVVSYTVSQMGPLNPRFAVEPSNFHLEAISVHAPGSFEGGEVVFWFTIAGDQEGSYFVPLHEEKPLLWHRDS